MKKKIVILIGIVLLAIQWSMMVFADTTLVTKAAIDSVAPGPTGPAGVDDVPRYSTFHELSDSLDAMGWLILFIGWLLYWLKKMDEEKRKAKVENRSGWFGAFVEDNSFECPISLIACVILALLSSSIPKDIIDMSGRLSVFIVGYSASSILNGLLTKFVRK